MSVHVDFFGGGGGGKGEVGASFVFRSDMLFIYNMFWPCIFCGTVFVCLHYRCRNGDMICCLG